MKKKFFIIVPIVIVILILMVAFTRNKYTGTWSNIIVYDNLKISSTIKISSNGNVVFEKLQSDTSEKYMRTGTWKKEKDHIVLVCDNTISLFPVLCELKKVNAKQVIIIISRDIGNLESNEFPYNHVYLIKSKEIDLEVLERANLSQAKNIIIFSRF